MSTNNNSIDLKSTPTIPGNVYDQLPEFLKDCCRQLQTSREKDVWLTASWGVLGGCLQNIQGRYKEGTYSPDLYVIIAAPSASGKGVLSLVRRLGIPLHNSLNAGPGTTPGEEQPVGDTSHSPEQEKCPPEKLLFIPADTSASMLVELLKRNDGRGIIFESEVDTLVNTLRQEWGLIDDKLRKGFHHEPISVARKNETTVIQIDRPRISMVMSGTIEQIIRLIRSPENGLFSRIVFYVFRQDFNWTSVEPCYSCTNPEEFFLQKGEVLLEISKHYETYPAAFTLSKDQWVKLDEYFAPMMREYPTIHGDDAAGVIARMGVITFRVSMILSSLRAWESKATSSNLQCSDHDFNLALTLGGIYAQHSMIMMQLLPRSTMSTLKEKDALYPQLPTAFSRADAITIGKRCGYAERSIDRWLHEWLAEGKLSQLKAGQYNKP